MIDHHGQVLNTSLDWFEGLVVKSPSAVGKWENLPKYRVATYRTNLKNMPVNISISKHK